MNSVVWCMMTVSVLCGIEDVPCVTETTVKGKIVNNGELYIRVDFSEYAKKQKYLGDWSEPKLVKKDLCIEDK